MDPGLRIEAVTPGTMAAIRLALSTTTIIESGPRVGKDRVGCAAEDGGRSSGDRSSRSRARRASRQATNRAAASQPRDQRWVPVPSSARAAQRGRERARSARSSELAVAWHDRRRKSRTPRRRARFGIQGVAYVLGCMVIAVSPRQLRIASRTLRSARESRSGPPSNSRT